MSSMLYTMGTALDRAAESGVAVSVLVEGAWIEGHVAAVDGMGVVVEVRDGSHAVIRVDRIAAVTVHTESPFRAALTATGQTGPTGPTGPAGAVPGPRTA